MTTSSSIAREVPTAVVPTQRKRSFFGPVVSLWRREIIRFVRQRSRLIGAFAQPLVFWVVLGGGMAGTFRPAAGTGGEGSIEYFYPGIVLMVLLFTAIFATIAAVEDRKSGFLQGVLVSPASRLQIVLGQVAGGSTLALLQGTLFLLLAPVAGITLTVSSFLTSILVLAILAFTLTSLGLVIAWRMDSTQGFHAIMNIVLLPLWFLSGAFFPKEGAPMVLAAVMTVNPLTYGLAALRRILYDADPELVAALPPLAQSVGLSIVAAIILFGCAVWTAKRARTA